MQHITGRVTRYPDRPEASIPFFRPTSQRRSATILSTARDRRRCSAITDPEKTIIARAEKIRARPVVT